MNGHIPLQSPYPFWAPFPVPHKFRICPRCSKWHWSKVYECKRCGLWYDSERYRFDCGDFRVYVYVGRTSVVRKDDWDVERIVLDFPVSVKITEEELYKYLVLQ